MASEHSRLTAADSELTGFTPTHASVDVLAQAFDAMRPAVLMLDSALRIILVNQRYLAVFGYHADHIHPGASLHELITHAVALGHYGGATVDTVLSEILAQVQEKRLATSFRIALSDGQMVTVHWQPMEAGGWICTHQEVSAVEKAAERLEHLTRHKTASGLPNRLDLIEALTLAGALPQGGEHHLICLRMNSFTQISARHGQLFAEMVMRKVAARLVWLVRTSDFVAHIGESHFAILPALTAGDEMALHWASQLLVALEMPIIIEGETIQPNFSIGIASTHSDSTGTQEFIEPENLLNNAALALHYAGQSGASRVQLYRSDIKSAIQASHSLELDLRVALEQSTFEVYYQPQIDTATQHVTGFEALLRWPHPTRGMVLPTEFIPMVEEMGLMHEVGAWVLRTACHEAAKWPDDISVAVNLSPSQFAMVGEISLSSIVAAALADSGLPGHRLELEITESVRMYQGASTLQTLHELRAMGVRIALDDFGTGYSSLSYLRSFPFDKIKIDQSFVRSLPTPQLIAIVRAVVALGASLGMTIVAEGVETPAQIRFLVSELCNELQGNLFGKASPVAELLSLIVDAPFKWQASISALIV